MRKTDVKPGSVIAVWFSCGAASAVAAKRTVDRYGTTCTVRILNNFVAEEDEDNRRFLSDVEQWLGCPIEIVTNPAYPSGSIEEVFERRKYMSGVGGAPCTGELKKRARQIWENANAVDWHVLGFTVEEAARHKRFILTERENLIPVLIEDRLTKDDCYEIVRRAGIALPRVYTESSRFGRGYPNANCIGCVKATSPTYWNHVRATRPDIFERRAEQSRRLGCRLVRHQGERLYLDELPEDAKGAPMKTRSAQCGLFCEEWRPE